MAVPQINIAIAGLGRIGQVHLQTLKTLSHRVNLVAVCDTDPLSAAPHVDAPYQHYHDYQQMLGSHRIDAIIIATPTPTHYDMIELAFSRGIHILCEKPLAPTLPQIKALHQFSERSKLKLQIGFNRRFDPNFAAIHRGITEGKIGDVHVIKVTSRDPAPPSREYLEASGGIFHDMTIHDIDMCRYMAAAEVTEVYARGAVRIDEAFAEVGDVDTAVVHLSFADGTMAIIDNSRQASYGYDQRLEVFGSAGMLQAQNNTQHNTQLYTQDGLHGSPLFDFFMDRYPSSFVAEVEAFVDAIIEKTDVLISAEDAYYATAIATACVLSLKENRVVKMSEVIGG